jgi:hypothetical protein
MYRLTRILKLHLYLNRSLSVLQVAFMSALSLRSEGLLGSATVMNIDSRFPDYIAKPACDAVVGALSGRLHISFTPIFLGRNPLFRIAF